MSSTTHNPRWFAGRSHFPAGTYLTDGKLLYYVVGEAGDVIELEESTTECIEYWRRAEVVVSFRKVEPCSIA